MGACSLFFSGYTISLGECTVPTPAPAGPVPHTRLHKGLNCRLNAAVGWDYQVMVKNLGWRTQHDRIEYIWKSRYDAEKDLS